MSTLVCEIVDKFHQRVSVLIKTFGSGITGAATPVCEGTFTKLLMYTLAL